jgi:transposase
MAGDSRKRRELKSHLVFIDETGCQLGPLVRRSLSRRGCTPVLQQQASDRKKVSVISALSYSPKVRDPNLYFQVLPDDYFNSAKVATFMRQLLRRLRGRVDVIWDGGSMHKGEPIRELCRQFGHRMTLHRLPPYAPELNPVEYLNNHLKYAPDTLCNRALNTVAELNAATTEILTRIQADRPRLSNFLKHSPLASTYWTLAT